MPRKRTFWCVAACLGASILAASCKSSRSYPQSALSELQTNNLAEQCQAFLQSQDARDLGYSEAIIYQGMFQALGKNRVSLPKAADLFARRLSDDFLHFSDLAYSQKNGWSNFRQSPGADSLRMLVRGYVAMLGPSYYGTSEEPDGGFFDRLQNNPLGLFIGRMREGAANMGDHFYEVSAAKFLTGLATRRGIEMHDLMLLYMMETHRDFFHIDEIMQNPSARGPRNLSPGEIFANKTTPSLACNNHAAQVITKPIPWAELGMDSYSGVGFVSWFHEPVARFRYEYPVVSSLIPVFGSVLAAGDSLLSTVEGLDSSGRPVGGIEGSAMFAFHFSIAVLEAFAVKATAVNAKNGAQRVLARTRNLDPTRSGLSEMSAVFKDEAMRIESAARPLVGRNLNPCAIASIHKFQSIKPVQLILDVISFSGTAFAGTVPCLKNLTNVSRLHDNISNGERLDVIKNIMVGDVMSAPGHRYLRDPKKVMELARQIEKTGDAGFGSEPIVLNIFTSTTDGGRVAVRSIEVVDGNHRIAAGLLSKRWQTLGDIPEKFLKIKVNGWTAGGSFSEPRWIPLEIAEKSSLSRRSWFRVPEHWQGVKGPTAQIPGDIASIDPVFPVDVRGVRMQEVLETSLETINAGN